MAMSAALFMLPSEASARHDCDEGHYRILEPNVSADPPTSCLGLEVVGEMKDCEHAQLRIDNQCDSFVKTLDDTQAYCELVGSGQSECQVIGSGIVGYVDLPWRKVVDTEKRQEHRYDVQVEGRTTFLFVSFESERIDSPEGEDNEEMMDADDDGGCSTAAPSSPASALSHLLLLALGLVGLRLRRNPRVSRTS
jgi:MYXO-CTERM domain-containing protein